MDSGYIERCVNEESEMWVLLERVHDRLVMPAKAEGGGPVSAGNRLLLAQHLQPMRETNPNCSVFKPKDEEKTDTSCFCCIHELVLTFRLTCFSVMNLHGLSGTSIFIGSEWRGSILRALYQARVATPP